MKKTKTLTEGMAVNFHLISSDKRIRGTIKHLYNRGVGVEAIDPDTDKTTTFLLKRKQLRLEEK